MSKFDTKRFRNVTVAFNTPYDSEDNLDTSAAKRLAEHYYQLGIRQLYLCGSTGEGFLLNSEERMALVDAIMEEVGDKMTIIVHVGCPSTRHSVELAKHAERAGAHATSAVPCVYYRPGEEAVFRHWTEIANAADLPFFIYNIPQLTGFNLSMNLFNRMLENDRVAGIKCSSDPVADIMKFKTAGGDDFIVFNGSDEQYLGGRIMGADAGIGGTYGSMPRLYLQLESFISAGNFGKAREMQKVITSLIFRECSFASLYGAAKALIRLDGVEIGNPRLPFLSVSSEDPELIRLHDDIKVAEGKFCV